MCVCIIIIIYRFGGKQFRNQNPIFPVTVPDAFHPHGNLSCVLYTLTQRLARGWKKGDEGREKKGIFGNNRRFWHAPPATPLSADAKRRVAIIYYLVERQQRSRLLVDFIYHLRNNNNNNLI